MPDAAAFPAATPLPTPEEFLRARGVEPLAWEDVLRRVETRLAPADAAAFARAHRAFVAYPAEHTARAFYDLAARHDLLGLLAGARHARLAAILAAVAEDVAAAGTRARAARALDVGAGGGFAAAWLRDVLGMTVRATDLSPATAARLDGLGFGAPDPGETFDLVLCADSLGEVHADEDDWLADPANADDAGYADELEARYGFASKLEPLRARLAPGGVVVLFEPVPQPHFWRGAARALEAAGWAADLRTTPAARLVVGLPHGDPDGPGSPAGHSGDNGASPPPLP